MKLDTVTLTPTKHLIVVYHGKQLIYPKLENPSIHGWLKRRGEMAHTLPKGFIHGCYLYFRPKESMIKISNQMRSSASSYTGLTCYFFRKKKKKRTELNVLAQFKHSYTKIMSLSYFSFSNIFITQLPRGVYKCANISFSSSQQNS